MTRDVALTGLRQVCPVLLEVVPVDIILKIIHTVQTDNKSTRGRQKQIRFIQKNNLELNIYINMLFNNV